ncbi:Protein 21.1 [Giardia lamblia P15]|uniref:Protein 21.1 n=1 Tax=Giardia intestinalis (strain P15) TaxID=658858 RepID=E1F2N2_GIAIA|nr:Protein 21.1 [Giardia lamblia P15]
MPSADDSSQFLRKHGDAPPFTPEKGTSEEDAGSPTEPSQTDDEGSVDEDGVTTLMKAASRNDVDAVKHYIPYQARMVAKFVKAGRVEIHEGTALMVAAVLGHAKVVKLLMKYERRMRSSNEYTALMWAAANGRTEVVRLLLEAEGGMEKGTDFTALTAAAYFGRLDCVKLLLEKEKDVGGESALYIADMEGCSEVVSFLKSEGIELTEPCLRMLPRKSTSGIA